MRTVVEISPGRYVPADLPRPTLPRRVEREPQPLPPCERCGAEGFTEAGDAADRGAVLCESCGALWLATVVGFYDHSLPVFIGTADADEQQSHAQALAAHDAADTATEDHARAERAAELNAARSTRRKQRGTAENRRLANAARDRVRATRKSAAERADEVARIVAEQPRSIADLAAALSVSLRTAARAVADAKRRGLVTVGGGRGATVRPAEQPQQH